MEVDTSDTEWEDIDDEVIKKKKKNNRKNVKNFSRACDRIKVSDRAGAFLGSALLMDHGLVKEGKVQHLICPSKLR